MVRDPTPLRFDQPVRPGGYGWWYLDAISDDRRVGLTLIMLVGSVFSPRYARARARSADADPEQHCAVNVAIYGLGERSRTWVMTEHAQVERAREHLRVGASSMRWSADQSELIVELDEHATRFFGRRGPPLRGRVRLRPSAIFAPRVELDHWRDTPRHRWYPVAPHARVEVEFDAPALRFSGSGYHDVNEGDEGLEQGFDSWTWARCELGETTLITYDVVDHDARPHARAWRFDPARDEIEELPETALGPATALPPTRWRVPRAIRSDPGHSPRLLHTLEDTPFYSRNLVAVRHGGHEGVAVHESLALDRFACGWVRFLLPFKIRQA